MYDDLTRAETECLVVSPADIPMCNKDKKFKTDRSASKNLAQQLKSGILEGIHVPDPIFDEQIKAEDKEIKDLSKLPQFKEDVKILSSAPGISTLSAMIFLVEIGDFSRFEDINHQRQNGCMDQKQLFWLQAVC